MLSPEEFYDSLRFYHSLPPVSKVYGTLCFLTTVAYQLHLISPEWIHLDFALVTEKYQIWRLFTNFLFLGGFSTQFGLRLTMIAKCGGQLEQGPFANRSADFLWMVITSMVSLSVVSLTQQDVHSSFMGGSLAFMLFYVWSLKHRVSLMGFKNLPGFLLPGALLLRKYMSGAPLMSDWNGIIIGHVYFFFAFFLPQVGGLNLIKTPHWVHMLVAKWSAAGPQAFSPAQSPAAPTVQGVRSA